MQGPDDLQLLGPVIKEQQKIIDSAIEKKIQLAKIQTNLLQKQLNTDNVGLSLSDDDREALNAMINKGETNSNDKPYKI